MILTPDPNGIRRNYTVAVRDKLYYIENIIFYKDNQIVIYTNNGWLETKTDTGTRDISCLEIPAEEIKLKRKPNAFDGTTYIIAYGKDWSGHLKANLYIPAADLGIHKVAYELKQNGNYVYTIWKGTQGIHIEFHTKTLCDALNLLRDRYEEAYEAADGVKMSILKEEIFRETLENLHAYAEEYFAERKRLANLTLEDLDLPPIEKEEENDL
jgi:hypothetical protein